MGVPDRLAYRWLETPPRLTRGLAVTRVHAAYPKALAEKPSSPPVLFVEGNVDALSRRAVAVVGTRRCTPYGASVARHLGVALGQASIVTVSGLARGIDTHAHRGTLSNGASVAVLGHGLAHTAPPSNRKLRDSLLANGGAMITTFPDEHLPRGGRFQAAIDGSLDWPSEWSWSKPQPVAVH